MNTLLSPNKLFTEIQSTKNISNLTSLGEGNIVFTCNANQYMLSTFKQALLKFRNQDKLNICEDWFSDVELLTQEQFDIILNLLSR